ncbi:MAG: cysteine--tRNA ligase [Clostridia bacterium]|nr:cysteine--tRNA ligase [Clostridia bacterium]
MAIRIYNSLTKQKEDFIPLNEGSVKMYACGITVSGHAHIGHAIQAMIFDIIRKYFEKQGYSVTYARNYTDVDDKIINNANKLGVDPMEFAKENMAHIDKQMERLGVDNATMTLCATKHIDRIIEFVSKLIDKGYAYSTENGDVYFAVEKFAGYGKLSNRNLEDAISGVRIDTEDNKRNPLDFALWKSAKPNEIYWDSPWGKGRPGWHIECSVMNYYNLGEQIDIHGGGRDLIFPHHENEIAQTESLTNKTFAKYWMHNGLVKVNGQKMSKSLGNGINLEDLLDKYDNEIIRFGLLQTNYKNDVNITDDLFDNAKSHMLHFYEILNKVNSLNIDCDKKCDIVDKEFNEAMDDDFNTAKALANLFGYFKTINSNLTTNPILAKEYANAVLDTYSLFGLFKKDPKEFIAMNCEKSDIPEDVKAMAEERWNAKKNKDWAKADELRNKLSDLGYVIKDSATGYEILNK